MTKSRRGSPGRALHLEMFVTPRRRRNSVRKQLRSIYSLARPPTRALGGAGPWIFRVTSKLGSPSVPDDARLRQVLGVKASEDLWVELAFYAGPQRMRTTIRRIRTSSRFERVAMAAERLTSRRAGTWTVDTAELFTA